MAELAAALVCDLAMVPELVPVLEAAILLGWAYAESIYDIKVLLAGGKVPLIKDEATWHYSLSGALSGKPEGQKDTKEGLSYEDYLRIFMMCMDRNILTARAMNMVEADIRLTPGNGAFRLDGCYAGLEACMEIESGYGFDFQATRKKFYID